MQCPNCQSTRTEKIGEWKDPETGWKVENEYVCNDCGWKFVDVAKEESKK